MLTILRSRVELWAAILVAALLSVPLLALYGGIVLSVEQGKQRFGAVGRIAHLLAEVPQTVRMIAKSGDRMKTFLPDRFADRPPGWTFAPGAQVPGYLLLSRHDGDRGRHVVSLVSLADGAVLHDWLPDADTLLAGADRSSPLTDLTGWTRGTWRAIHPLPMPDGGLVVKDHQGPLFRIDACGGRVWMNDSNMFHHSTEADGTGGFWVPSLIEPQTVEGVLPEFYEDGLAHLDAEGRVIQEISLTQVLLDHGMKHLMFAADTYDHDPTHLNDIEPVHKDGPYWKKGDLFLSLKHLSMVMLYRPSTDEIVWMKRGPWLVQHDVDILGPTTIGVFNNNGSNLGNGPRVQGASDVMVYDFATDQVSEPFRGAAEREEIKTLFEGLFTMLPDGGVMIEEENSGRILFLGGDGALRATFINTGADGAAYRLGWSRWLSEADGAALAATLAATTCPAAAE
jgi:hypothetical protein